MDQISYRTQHLSKTDIQKEWFVVDVEGQTLGRVASEIAKVVRGKNKPTFTPNADCGDNVIVINAEKIKLTGAKWDKKEYISHSGHPGGQKRVVAKDRMAKKPTFLVEAAVKGMLPKTKLGRAIAKNLFVYAGTEHPHEAQTPSALKF